MRNKSITTLACLAFLILITAACNPEVKQGVYVKLVEDKESIGDFSVKFLAKNIQDQSYLYLVVKEANPPFKKGDALLVDLEEVFEDGSTIEPDQEHWDAVIEDKEEGVRLYQRVPVWKVTKVKIVNTEKAEKTELPIRK